MIASKKTINQQVRIGLAFSMTNAHQEAIRKIQGAEYCAEEQIWHIPYTPKAFGDLLKAFPDTLYPNQVETQIPPQASDNRLFVSTIAIGVQCSCREHTSCKINYASSHLEYLKFQLTLALAGKINL